MPTPINLYGSPEFVFNCANTFPERFDPMDELYFSGKTMKLGDRLTQSNFIPSVLNMTLDNWSYRGPERTCTSSWPGAGSSATYPSSR